MAFTEPACIRDDSTDFTASACVQLILCWCWTTAACRCHCKWKPVTTRCDCSQLVLAALHSHFTLLLSMTWAHESCRLQRTFTQVNFCKRHKRNVSGTGNLDASEIAFTEM